MTIAFDTSTWTTGDYRTVKWGPARTFGADSVRIMAAFVDRAEALPGEAERILRDGMDYAAQFCAGATVEDEAALIRAAGRYLDRNYPVSAA